MIVAHKKKRKQNILKLSSGQSTVGGWGFTSKMAILSINPSLSLILYSYRPQLYWKEEGIERIMTTLLFSVNSFLTAHFFMICIPGANGQGTILNKNILNWVSCHLGETSIRFHTTQWTVSHFAQPRQQKSRAGKLPLPSLERVPSGGFWGGQPGGAWHLAAPEKCMKTTIWWKSYLQQIVLLPWVLLQIVQLKRTSSLRHLNYLGKCVF